MGIMKTRTTPFNPKSDGLVERMNRTVTRLLGHVISRSATCKAAGVDNPLRLVGEDGQQRKAKALRQRNPKTVIACRASVASGDGNNHRPPEL